MSFSQLISLLTDIPRRRQRGGEQIGDGLDQPRAHLRGTVGVLDGMKELSLVGLHAAQQEAITELADHAIIAVVDTSAAEQQTDLAGPLQGPAAIGADDAGPFAVVDLAQRGQQLGLGLRPHAQDRAEILQHQESDAPIFCSKPPLAPAACWRRGVPDSSPASSAFRPFRYAGC